MDFEKQVQHQNISRLVIGSINNDPRTDLKMQSQSGEISTPSKVDTTVDFQKLLRQSLLLCTPTFQA